MSLHPQTTYPIPEDTQRVARAAFPKGNLYMRMRDELGEIYQDASFAELFPGRGQKAKSPGRLAWVTVMQYSEGMSDRQAAEAVRARGRLEICIGVGIGRSGFNYSVLSEFRERLVAGQKEQLLLDELLSRLKELKLLKAGGQQRSDVDPYSGGGAATEPGRDCGGDDATGLERVIGICAGVGQGDCEAGVVCSVWKTVRTNAFAKGAGRAGSLVGDDWRRWRISAGGGANGD